MGVESGHQGRGEVGSRVRASGVGAVGVELEHLGRGEVGIRVRAAGEGSSRGGVRTPREGRGGE